MLLYLFSFITICIVPVAFHSNMEIRAAAMFIFDNYLLLTTNTRKLCRERENKLQVEQTSENHMSVTFLSFCT
jgi:hypothetical protein